MSANCANAYILEDIRISIVGRLFENVGGHFLSGITQRVPSAKLQKLSEHFDRQYQNFIDLTVPGNLYGT